MAPLPPPGQDPAAPAEAAGLRRLIDANLNRAGEGLRVVEDCCRFALDDAPLTLRARELRHALRQLPPALGLAPLAAALFRDPEGDVGRAGGPRPDREDLAAVAAASCRRTAEALRCLEEAAKAAAAPAAAALAEGWRFALYALERDLARRLNPAAGLAGARLLVIVTARLCRRPWAEAAEAACRGGADLLELREKELGDRELLGRARRLGELARRHGARLLVNDRPDLAALAGADGVHLGQDDLPPAEARRLLGPGRIIGLSTHAPEQGRRGQDSGADYLAVGPVFATPTKPEYAPVGEEYVRWAAGALTRPFFAVGGINAQTIGRVLAAGARRVAVCTAVIGEANPEAAARQLKERLLQAAGEAAGDGR